MMCGNKLERLPLAVRELTFLTTLHLDNSGIKDVPLDRFNTLVA
jgi:Leucine-rich repeat (LRR) protein